MKGKGKAFQLFIAVSMIGLTGVASAQESRISGSVDGGVSQPVGVYANEYNTGFNVGTSWFYWPLNPVGFGIRFGYDRWGADGDNVIEEANKQVGFSIASPEVEGSANIFEFIPSVRLGSGLTRLPLNIDAQIGYGLYLLRTLATVTGTNISGAAVSEVVGKDEWEARSGFQFRANLGIAPVNVFSVHFIPMYNIVFHGAHQIQYFNANLSFNLVF